MVKKLNGFCFKAEDRPGVIASLADIISKAGINIDACAAISFNGKGVIYFTTNNPQAATDALNKAGTKFETHELLEINVQDKPGELAKISHSLSEAKINIHAMFMTMRKTIILEVDQIEQAIKILQKSH